MIGDKSAKYIYKGSESEVGEKKVCEIREREREIYKSVVGQNYDDSMASDCWMY